MNDQSRMLVRAATGPIILITVGTLFTLEKFTPYHFAQTWPVLLIIIGLLKLVGGRSCATPRRMRGGRIPAPPPARNPFPPMPPQPPTWQTSPPPPPYSHPSEPMPDMTPPPPPRPGERR